MHPTFGRASAVAGVGDAVIGIKGIDVVDRLSRAEFEAMTERRAFARHKTFIKGRIISTTACPAWTASCGTSRTSVPGWRFPRTLPSRMHSSSIFRPEQEHFQARVKWRKGNILGIAWGGSKARSLGST